jgi:hypothetical protein
MVGCFATRRERPMSTVTTLRLEDTVRKRLQARAMANRRSLSEQIKYYLFLGIVAEDNPDLPLLFIKDLLEAKEEALLGLAAPYRWGVLK